MERERENLVYKIGREREDGIKERIGINRKERERTEEDNWFNVSESESIKWRKTVLELCSVHIELF